MGLFSKRGPDPEEIERLRQEIAAMSARLQATESDRAELGSRVAGVVDRLDRATPPPPEPPPPPAPTVDPAEMAEVHARVAELADRLEGLDRRITSVSAELANQLTELSRDLEAVGGDAPASDEVVAELRDAQTRIANEQARYQIAFRQDLAEIADQLKRR